MAERSFIPGVIPVQIRPDLTVFIANIPWDLTANEADKIAAVVMAMAARAQSGRDDG